MMEVSESVITLGKWVRRWQMGRWRKQGQALAVGVLAALVTIAPVPWPVSPVMAATFTVNTTADTVDVAPGDGTCADSSGNCSLRAAIMEANALAGADTIVLSFATYTLDPDPTAGDEDTAAEDDLDIVVGSTITIHGNGAMIRRSTLVMCDLDGTANPGEFRIFEVASASTLTLRNVTVQDGCADGAGFPDIAGGGILNFGTIAIANGTISGNRAKYGGGISNYGTLLTITNSSISSNSASIDGGGVLNVNGTATIANSAILGNDATWSGGGINNFSGLIITHTTISNNNAGYGGGLGNGSGGTVTITSSTFSGNRATNDGGGINNFAGTLTITNSTLSGNSAVGGFGGGVWNGGTANLSFMTIASNAAGAEGGGVHINGGTLNIKNSIVGNNTSAVGPNCQIAAGTFTPSGVNLATDTSCPGFASVTSAQLNLGPLANNGGPMETHALLSGSVAIDAVPSGQCTNLASAPVTQDQRGVSRPQGSNCDVGAYEAPASLVRRVTLQGGGNCLLLDLEARTYRFRTSMGSLYMGPINLARRGSRIQFSNLRTGETWIMGGVADLTPPGRGQAVLRTYSPWHTFSIADPNLSDNTCVP